jgi:predicted transcriptional regulator
MEATIPSSSEVRIQLERLGHADVQALAKASEVPFTTLWKIRSGETENPGLETVRKFMPHMREALSGKPHAAVER